MHVSGGTPTVTLNDGGTATYVGVGDSGQLLFTSTVQPGQNSSDLEATGISLNGATLADGYGRTVVLASLLPAVTGPRYGVLRVDTTAPAVTAALAGGVLAGGGDPGATVTVSEGDDVLGSAAADAGGAWSFDASALPVGPHVITVSETDAVGNTGVASVRFTVPAPSAPAQPALPQPALPQPALPQPALPQPALPQPAPVQTATPLPTPDPAGPPDATPPAAPPVADGGEAGMPARPAAGPVDGAATPVDGGRDVNGAAPQLSPGAEAVTLPDGTFSVGPDTDEAFIQRLYLGLLGRSGDAGGIGFFDAQLHQGASQAQVTAGVLDSAEYAARHGTAQSPAQFVVGLYAGLLGRPPTTADLDSWTGALDGGQARAAVAAAIANSADAKAALAAGTAAVWSPDPDGTLVRQLFQAGLGRAAEPVGAAFWADALRNGATPGQVAAGIAGSAEFAADHAGQDAAAFVASLYQGALGRVPDAAGAQFWAGGLQSGSLAPGEVLLGIGNSAEVAAHLARTP